MEVKAAESAAPSRFFAYLAGKPDDMAGGDKSHEYQVVDVFQPRARGVAGFRPVQIGANGEAVIQHMVSGMRRSQYVGVNKS